MCFLKKVENWTQVKWYTLMQEMYNIEFILLQMDYEYIFYAVLPSCCDNSMVLHKKFSYNIDNNSEYQPSGSFYENIKL